MTDQEIAAAIQEVRERARAHAPQGPLGLEGVVAADLMPLVHARDAAEAKVAAIGTVNPRAGGLANSFVQGVKKLIARSMDWHVREQVEFNRASMACVQASMEALTSVARSLAAVASHLQAQQREVDELKEFRGEVRQVVESQAQIEERYLKGEIHVLRTISELQAAYQHRLTVQEEANRDLVRAQHRDYLDALDRGTLDIQKRLWEDLAKVRQEFERIIHNELRLVRQRGALASAGGVAPAASAGGVATAAGHEEIPMDWIVFANRFRGSEERIRGQQGRYVARFDGTTGVILDIGCGRGEFLEAARDAGLVARGIDLSEESVAVCRQKGLDAECADLFEYLAAQPDGSVAGIYCAQVVEHLTPAEVARFIALLGSKLSSGALVAIETPNPECLAIFASHFYIDPTHTRPVPASVLRFYFEEAGCGGIEVEYLEPAVDTMPSLTELPVSFREAFFGGLDYSIFARKL
ncbi:MAG: methyltransferase domain-containing protein [Acidobacteriota bacterium]